MAEVKLAMHKEMLGKDEVGFGAILRRYQIDNDTPGDHNHKQMTMILPRRSQT